MALAFLAVSTLLQGVALGFAVRIAQARAARGWMLLVAALGLMFVRRAFSFQAAALQSRPGDPIAELIALAISGLLVLGLSWLARVQPRTAKGASQDRSLERNESLKRRALVLAGVSLAGACLLAVLVYTASRSMVTASISRDSQQVAHVLAGAAVQAREHDAPVLLEIERLWHEARAGFPGSYLCVIGADGRLALNTARPAKIGTYVGDVVLPETDTFGKRSTIAELLRAHGDWIGRNRNHAGRAQIAAYVYSPTLKGLIAVHTGAVAIDSEVRRAVLPWLAALGSVLFFLFPVSLGLLYHVTSRSQDAASEAEQRSRETEDRYRQIVETTTQGVWMIDAEARTVFANERMAKMLGCTLAQLQGRSIRDFLDEDGRRCAQHMLSRRKQGIADVHEVRLTRQDGTRLWVSLSANPVFGPSGEHIGGLAMISDVSDRRSMEEQVRQAQKMQAVGQLAGGVAHDFNNLLTVIEVNACLLAEPDCSAARRVEHADEIKEAVQRASALTRRLLAFSRKRAVQLTVVDVAEVVSKTAAMLRRILGEHIKVETSLATGLPSVLADRALLEQALLNLIVNARDAMPDGGRLCITTSEGPSPSPTLQSTQSLQSDSSADGSAHGVLVRIADSGCGIAPEIVSRIFEPFFTTKDVERGTGLGLAMVYSCVQQHHGAITVDSQVGAGSTFTIWLPAHVAAAEPAHEPVVGILTKQASDATVLLAEDDELVRPVMVQALTRCGYRVLAAESAQAALALWRTHREQIHLLLTDLRMPGGMTGSDLALRLRAEAPHLPVVFMTGYGAELQANACESVPDAAFLYKPCTPDALRTAVAEQLASPRLRTG